MQIFTNNMDDQISSTALVYSQRIADKKDSIVIEISTKKSSRRDTNCYDHNCGKTNPNRAYLSDPEHQLAARTAMEE
eukprot:m.396036 g.396036  ORF g.396036 m.396036 type:complete len:77 (+) comp21107_c0_seq1:2461-2691(+)